MVKQSPSSAEECLPKRSNRSSINLANDIVQIKSQNTN